MPIKKSPAAPKAASPKSASKAVAEHAHAALEAEIAALKKEVEALKGQCHSCCADLAELKSAAKVESKDDRIEELLSNIVKSINYAALRRKYKNN